MPATQPGDSGLTQLIEDGTSLASDFIGIAEAEKELLADLEAAGFQKTILRIDSEPDCSESEAEKMDGAGAAPVAEEPDIAMNGGGPEVAVAKISSTDLTKMQEDMTKSFATMLASALVANNTVLAKDIDTKIQIAIAPIIERSTS